MSLGTADVRRLGLAVFERRRDKMHPKLAKALRRLALAQEWSNFTTLVLSEAIRAGDLLPIESEQAMDLTSAGLLAD